MFHGTPSSASATGQCCRRRCRIQWPEMQAAAPELLPSLQSGSYPSLQKLQMPRAREETISCEFLTDILQPLQVTQSFLGKLGWRASPQRKRNDGKKEVARKNAAFSASARQVPFSLYPQVFIHLSGREPTGKAC